MNKLIKCCDEHATVLKHTRRHPLIKEPGVTTSLNNPIRDRAAIETAFSRDFLYSARSCSKSSFINYSPKSKYENSTKKGVRELKKKKNTGYWL